MCVFFIFLVVWFARHLENIMPNLPFVDNNAFQEKPPSSCRLENNMILMF